MWVNRNERRITFWSPNIANRISWKNIFLIFETLHYMKISIFNKHTWCNKDDYKGQQIFSHLLNSAFSLNIQHTFYIVQYILFTTGEHSKVCICKATKWIVHKITFVSYQHMQLAFCLKCMPTKVCNYTQLVCSLLMFLCITFIRFRESKF